LSTEEALYWHHWQASSILASGGGGGGGGGRNKKNEDPSAGLKTTDSNFNTTNSRPSLLLFPSSEGGARGNRKSLKIYKNIYHYYLQHIWF
jgi:hypothetical protein